MNRTAAYLLLPDDPRLTAFALGELEGAEHTWVAGVVADRPDLQYAVDEIRRAAEELTAALAAEPLPEVEPVQLVGAANGHARPAALIPFPPQAKPAAIPPVNGARHVSGARASTYFERTSAARRREPRLSYFWVMTLSAACFMLVLFVSERRYSAAEEAETARVARLAATERARTAAAAAANSQRHLLEFNLSDDAYAHARLPGRETGADVSRDEETYQAAEHRPNSSFPIDVATTSYGDVLRAIAARQLPPAGSVRIEEMLNTFAYDYPEPAADDEAPFAASLEAADAPWAPGHRLVRIGLKGRTDAGGATAAIARNVSIQVQFNAETVRAYRLIGYEKSPLVAQETLSAGRVDAAEVHAGHTVTALYEVIPAVAIAPAPLVVPAATEVTRLLSVRIAYTRPDGVAARPLEFPLDDRGASFGDASGDFKFAAAVAGFGMKLRQPGMGGPISYHNIIAWAEQGAHNDRTGLRQEFVGLVREASTVVVQ